MAALQLQINLGPFPQIISLTVLAFAASGARSAAIQEEKDAAAAALMTADGDTSLTINLSEVDSLG